MAYFKLPSIRVNLFGYQFSARWLPTLATLLLLALLVTLGRWQLHRGAEKKAMEQDFQRHKEMLTIEDLRNYPTKALRYQMLQVHGQPDNAHLIYLDNKTFRGQAGMQVLVPVKIPGQVPTLLINRGFVAVPNRTKLPALPTLGGEQTFQGLILMPAKPFLLKPEVWRGHWPMLVQGVDLTALSKQLQTPLFPFILLQTSPQEPGIIREWHPVNFPSYRHTGYAVQWFALALTLVIIYVRVNTRKIK